LKDSSDNPSGGGSASLLSGLRSPADIRNLDDDQLAQLAQEIRERLINVTSVNGGHLGPNLGVVELTIALHLVFETPRDRFVFDVSHQGYVHKLFTGRGGPEFDRIRKSGGLSGFLARAESEHDCYGAGHAGTALSAALGMATARDHLGLDDQHVVAVGGDAAFTCGITMEALNNVCESTKRLVIILNDNEWSIARNVGAISRYLNELITNPIYNRLHQDIESLLQRVPGGKELIRIGQKAEKGWKSMVLPSSLFEKYGVRYVGPIDGHDLPALKRNLEFAKRADSPILLHVVTVKGKGYQPALDKPEKFHGTSPFEIATGGGKKKAAAPPNYQDVFGQAMVRFAKRNPKIVGITGAMPSGTGLIHLAEALPGQFYDVGIAEEHAVLFAAGLATQGMRPVCAIYSTFLQRAYDQIIHDVCLQNLPVVFCMDRAGLSPNDGPTHHGLFDIAYVRCVPNAIGMQPKDEAELIDMMRTALAQQQPAFIRYPRGAGVGVPTKGPSKRLPIGKAEILREGSEIVLWALGNMSQDALALAETLAEEDGLDVGVVNARFYKPLDEKLLLQLARQCSLLVTLEDGVLKGGMGSAVAETLVDNDVAVRLHRIGWPDTFVDHGDSPASIRAQHGLDRDSMLAGIRAKLGAESAALTAR